LVDCLKKVSIVLPTYNEKENIKLLIPRIFQLFEKNNINGNVIVVDDNSPDGTADTVIKLQKSYPVMLINRPKKMGIGSAYITGFEKALENGSDIIFEMDADLSHNPETILDFLKKIDEGFDVVIGSRRMEGGEIIGWGVYRKTVSKSANFVGKYLAGINGINDLTSGYRAYTKDALKKIDLKKIKSSGYAFQLEILTRLLKKGLKVGLVPIIFCDRYSGKSKLSRMDIINFFLITLKIRCGWL